MLKKMEKRAAGEEVEDDDEFGDDFDEDEMLEADQAMPTEETTGLMTYEATNWDGSQAVLQGKTFKDLREAATDLFDLGGKPYFL